MMVPIDRIIAKMRHWGEAERIIERVARLNPDGITPGSWPRGYHPHWRYQPDPAEFGLVGKGAFITKYGREAWDALPGDVIRKNGRRQYVEQTAVEDMVWLGRGRGKCRQL